LGLTGYYWRFISNCEEIARLFTDLLKKGNFQLSQDSTAASEQLQVAVITTPILARSVQQFCIECDGFGASYSTFWQSYLFRGENHSVH